MMRLYKKEGQVAERPHLNLPADTFEEEIGLEGFYGPVSHLYHFNPPTSWTNILQSNFQWPNKEEAPEEFLKPQCYKKTEAGAEGDFFQSGRLLFWNEDIGVHIHRINCQSDSYFRNADASEIYFCHEGSASLKSAFGELAVEKGDYVVVPKGVTYRWDTQASLYLLRLESFKEWPKKPDTGLLGQQALFHEESIRSPVFKKLAKPDSKSFVRVQKDGKLTQIDYAYDLCDISGWCGTLYPYALSVKKIAPVMSSVAHLPPSINSTFVTNGFVVCSFLPRPLEEPEGALKVPFFHSNIDYDEVIFYHEGNFFSRDNMDKGYITLHPRGINHGPHPKALKAQHRLTRTNETAVMIDTAKTLHVSRYARELEIKDYWRSWMS